MKMLNYDRIYVSERIDNNKTSKSKECKISHYWYFLNKAFKFQPNASNGYHDLVTISMNLSNVAILNIKGFDYRRIIRGINKT